MQEIQIYISNTLKNNISMEHAPKSHRSLEN